MAKKYHVVDNISFCDESYKVLLVRYFVLKWWFINILTDFHIIKKIMLHIILLILFRPRKDDFEGSDLLQGCHEHVEKIRKRCLNVAIVLMCDVYFWFLDGHTIMKYSFCVNSIIPYCLNPVKDYFTFVCL